MHHSARRLVARVRKPARRLYRSPTGVAYALNEAGILVARAVLIKNNIVAQSVRRSISNNASYLSIQIARKRVGLRRPAREAESPGDKLFNLFTYQVYAESDRHSGLTARAKISVSYSRGHHDFFWRIAGEWLR